MTAELRLAHWVTRLPDGTEFSTDDLTLDELDLAESISGTPYSLLNPGGRAKDAKAMFLVGMLRAGASEDEAKQKLLALTLADARQAFRYVEATFVDSDGEPLPPS